MSDTEEYVQPPINVPFTKPMELASEPKQEEPAPFESSDAGLREAASELVDAPPEPDPIIVRDVQTGKPRPSNETLSAEQAGRELARYRNSIADQKEAASDAAVAAIVDHVQANALNPDLQPQPQQQVEPQPQPQHTEAQPAQVPDGIDPDIVRELEQSPKLREALRNEAHQIEAAKQTYSDVVRQNAQAATAALLISFPELQGVPTENLKTALQVMANQNPQRASEAIAHIQQTSALVQQWQDDQAAHNQQAQRHYQKQWQEFAKAEDLKADQLIGPVDEKLTKAAAKTLTDVGISHEDIRRLWHGEASLSLRDSRAQAILADAARWRMAQAAMHNATRAPAPPFIRPGVSGARADEYSQSELSGLTNRLNQTGNLKDAARLLVARRSRG